MFELRVGSVCGRRQIGRCLKLLGALALLTLPATAPAMATTTPAAGFEQFTGCPHPGQNPLILTCFREVFKKGGKLQMGNVEIPISKPITFSGGETSAGVFDSNSFGGMLKASQEVPGGVVGLTGFTWLEEILRPKGLSSTR